MTYESPHCVPASDDKPDQGNTFNIHGKPGSGKTFAALAASSDFPEDLAAQRKKFLETKKELTLNDIIYVRHDNKGDVGLRQFGIRPKYVIDFRALLKKHGFLKALEIISLEPKKICQADPNVRFVIEDTITRLDSRLVTFVMNPKNGLAYMTRSDEVNRQSTYLVVAELHHEHFESVVDLPEYVTPIFLFHQKVITPPTQGDMKAKKALEAQQLNLKIGNAMVTIVPEITGKSAAVYIGEASQELVCVNTGKKRFLSADVYQGQRAKNRFPEIIKGEQEPHMGKLLAKIREGCV